MSSISSINTSDYSYLLDSIATLNGYTSKTASSSAIPAVEETNQGVNLNDYYKNLASGDLLQTVAENIVQSSNDLNNAMVNALENGYTVQDAVNIQEAKAAYEANCRVAKSTFEIAI